MLVLGVAGSPRRSGNSELLLDEALAGVREAGAAAEKIVLAELCLSPCTACGTCDKTGRCPIADDMQEITAYFPAALRWSLLRQSIFIP